MLSRVTRVDWVPKVVMGGGQGSGSQAMAGSGAMSMLEIMAIKAAHDLGVDMSVSGTSRTKGGGK
jgi:hypothetical protein